MLGGPGSLSGRASGACSLAAARAKAATAAVRDWQRAVVAKDCWDQTTRIAAIATAVAPLLRVVWANRKDLGTVRRRAIARAAAPCRHGPSNAGKPPVALAVPHLAIQHG